MQINYLGEGRFELKTKNININLDQHIKIGEFNLPGEGEYEIGGVSVEYINNIILLNAEDLNIAYIENNKNKLTTKEIEKINGVELLFIPIFGKEIFSPKKALDLINQIEPKIVIPMNYENIEEFSGLEGVNAENLDILKITKSQIDEEHRKTYILSCK